ncbi:MAG: flavodoxin-dependent (E)-4-hydroxy-3-methylbut-2-enyl-diphosphate synthase, partial [Kiritimatiellota bacterium]|nr:flavodoxin-dependent (E)-4-hydroxy-3-methylbut-2-enyl-diphosphate synthase [Kiritimatiellota bacterium]
MSIASSSILARRRKTRRIHVGPVAVGGGAPVSVQTMTKTDTRDVRATIAQIRDLERAGCDIIRVAVPDEDAARA